MKYTNQQKTRIYRENLDYFRTGINRKENIEGINMTTYNAKEVGKILMMQEKTVASRALSFGFKKNNHNKWCFSLSQIEKIKAYVPKRFHNTKFSFSDDGGYLIINSKLNKQEL